MKNIVLSVAALIASTSALEREIDSDSQGDLNRLIAENFKKIQASNLAMDKNIKAENLKMKAHLSKPVIADDLVD